MLYDFYYYHIMTPRLWMIKHHALKSFIAHLSDIPIFYIKYLKTHKVHVYAGAIRQLLYGCVYVRVIILPYIRTHHTITYTKPEMVNIIYRVKIRVAWCQ